MRSNIGSVEWGQWSISGPMAKWTTQRIDSQQEKAQVVQWSTEIEETALKMKHLLLHKKHYRELIKAFRKHLYEKGVLRGEVRA